MKKVSCLMPTFNRFPNRGYLVNEAIQSFLQQDYPNKELIVCNDTPGQKLIFYDENVKVFNVEERFPTLTDKLSWMIEQAEGEVLTRWDDDDISLPHRLSYSMDKLGDKLEWRPENYWYYPILKRKPIQYTVHPGNTHCMSVWRREVLDEIGGYPAKASGWEDQEFNHLIFRKKISKFTGEIIPAEDIFYVYRWETSRHHLSAIPSSDKKDLQRHYDDIGKRRIVEDMWSLDPIWREDHIGLASEALNRYRKEFPVAI